jgi:hypothetical protein
MSVEIVHSNSKSILFLSTYLQTDSSKTTDRRIEELLRNFMGSSDGHYSVENDRWDIQAFDV